MAQEVPFKVGPSFRGTATVTPSAGALIPGNVSGPDSRSVLRIANKGLYSLSVALGTDDSVNASDTNTFLIGPGDTDLFARGVFTHFSVMGLAREPISGVTNGTTEFSITAGDGA